MNPDGSGLRLLAKKFGREPGEGDGFLFAPAFTPDGSQITYINGTRTTHQSVVVRPATGGRPRLHPFEGYLLSSALSFSPDGRFAVVSRLVDPPQRSAIYVASTIKRSLGEQLTGSPPRKNVWDLSPDWSPDGRHIVFSREVGDGPYRLTLQTRSSNAVRELGRGWQPDWSPDGRLIAFGRPDGVYVCRPDGSALRRVVAAKDPGLPTSRPMESDSPTCSREQRGWFRPKGVVRQRLPTVPLAGSPGNSGGVARRGTCTPAVADSQNALAIAKNLLCYDHTTPSESPSARSSIPTTTRDNSSLGHGSSTPDVRALVGHDLAHDAPQTLMRPVGIEPTTSGSGGQRSIP